MGWYYTYIIHFNWHGQERKYEIGSDNLDTALGVFFQDHEATCYNDIIEIETIENE